MRIEVQDYFVGMNIRPKVVDYSKNSRVRTQNFGGQAEQFLIFWGIFPITG